MLSDHRQSCVPVHRGHDVKTRRLYVVAEKMKYIRVVLPMRMRVFNIFHSQFVK